MLRTRTPHWLSRNVVLAVDALFGLVLLVIAFGTRLPFSTTEGTQAAPAGAASVEVTTHFGRLNPQAGFAVAPDGSLAVVDRERNVVMRLDSDGQPQAEWGPGFGAGLDARDLVGIAADADGWFVLDRGAPRILRLDNQGHAQPDRTIDLSKLETYGPNGLATDGHGDLFMADTGRDRLMSFNSSGTMVDTIGDAGSELGKFKQPMFLAFGPDGSLFVTDWENSRVERFSIPDRQATNAWPLPVHAWGIAVDGAGRVYIPDGDHHLVRMFGPDGTLLAQIGGDQSMPLPLEGIAQVGVSPDGSRLWVLGGDALARVDLTPYGNVRPAALQANRTPLAVLGIVLLLVAAVGAARPTGRRIRLPRLPARPPERAVAVEAPRGREVPRWRPAAGVAPLLGPMLLAVGAVAAVLAELAVADPAAKLNPWPRMAGLVMGSLIFAAGAVLSAQIAPWRWIDEWPGCARTVCRRITWHELVVLPLVVALAGVAALTWWQGRFQTPEANRGLLLWLAGLVLTVATLLAGSHLRRPSLWTLVPWALFVLALVPRAWHNADLPYGVWFDEAEAGLQARKFLQNLVYTPITDTYGRDASLQYYFIAAAQAVISDPVLAGRLVSAVIGALCAPLMYLLGRQLFGWRVGVVAGLLIVTLRWHLDVSRLGWDPISLPLCAILAFWLLARAIRSGSWSDAVWAGLGLGLGMHAYVGFRVLPIVGFVLLLYGGWLRGWPPLMYAGRIAAAVGGAMLAALPVIVFAVQDPAGFNGRLNQTLILNEQVSQAQKLDELWTNLQKHLLMFHVSGDMNGRHNLPGAPMLDPLSGLLMVVGLAVLAVRPFDWRAWLVFGWTASSMAGGIFTFPFEAPQAMRTLGVTPVLPLMIALALVVALDRGAAFVPLRRRLVSVTAAAGACAVVAWLGVTNLGMFFGRQMNDPTVWESFSTRETLPSRAALETRQPYEFILGSSTVAPSLQQQLLVPSIQNTIHPFDLSVDLPYRGNGPALVVLEDEHDSGLADEVARYYPDATRRPIVPPNGTKPTADELVLDPRVIAAHRGLAASRQPDGTWRADVAADVPGVYGLLPPSGFALTVDGLQVPGAMQVQLARGNHIVTLTGSSGETQTPELMWQPPGAADWQPVDDRLVFSAPDGGNGLLATFYPTQDFQGSPTESIVDPVLAHYYHLSPFSRINLGPQLWSAEWRGTIDVPRIGTYRFEAERLSRAGLWLDGKVVFDDTADGAGPAQAASVQLTAGTHQIRVRMQQRGDGGPRLYLYWTPPGGAREIVPGRVLYPPAPALAQ